MITRLTQSGVASIVALHVLSVAAPADQLLLDLRTQFEQALMDFDQALQIHTEQPDRARQLFRSAAQRFESIVAAGISNGRLEYNLGNCYLQAGDVGRAILHYRRAQRLIPRDPLLADNLAEARSRCLTSIKPTRRSALLRSVFFWHYDTSTAGRCRVGLVLYVAFWVLLVVRNFVANRTVNGCALVCAGLTLVLTGSLAFDEWADRRAPDGVVTAMDVTVYKGPGSGYQRQFEEPLQPGVEFVLREQRGGWWNVELADGKGGWIEAAAAGRVIGPAPPSSANQP